MKNDIILYMLPEMMTILGHNDNIYYGKELISFPNKCYHFLTIVDNDTHYTVKLHTYLKKLSKLFRL